MLAQLAPLDVQLGLDQLALRGDGGVLAGGHGEGAGGEAREAGDDDGLLGDGAAGDAGHQGEVGDQAVHRAEHRGPQPAAVDVTVGVVVAVRLVQRRLGLDDGHTGPPGKLSQSLAKLRRALSKKEDLPDQAARVAA